MRLRPTTTAASTRFEEGRVRTTTYSSSLRSSQDGEDGISEPYGWVPGLLAGDMPSYGTVVFDLSPILSAVLILLAVAPGGLRFVEAANWMGYLSRAILFALPVLWMLNVFVGPRSVMIDKLINRPLAQSGMIPFYAGVFMHVVFQHWFQAVTVLVFSLVPEKFGTLVESKTPAGVQCAVVDCE